MEEREGGEGGRWKGVKERGRGRREGRDVEGKRKKSNPAYPVVKTTGTSIYLVATAPNAIIPLC